MTRMSTGVSTSSVGLAKFRKFVTTLPSASVSPLMPSTYGRYSGGSWSSSSSRPYPWMVASPLRNSWAMPAVSSPSRARLSFRRSCSSSSMTSVRSVKRQMAPCVLPASSRIGETVTPRCEAPPGPVIGTERRTIALPGAQAFVDDGGERPGAGQHLAERPFPVVPPACRASCSAAGFSVLHHAVFVHDEQAGRHARDDLAAQALRGLGPRLHRAFLHAQPAERLLHRGRHDSVSPAGGPRSLATPAPRRRTCATAKASTPASTPTMAVSPSSEIAGSRHDRLHACVIADLPDHAT